VRIMGAVRQRVTTHRFFWSLAIFGFVSLALAVVAVVFWLGLWDRSARIAVLLAVIEGLTLLFAVFAGYVAAQAYAAAQAKPELDLVLTKDHVKEVTFEANQSGRLMEDFHIYILNRGDAGAGYFTVELYFPEQLVTRVSRTTWFYPVFQSEDWLNLPPEREELGRTLINKGARIAEKQGRDTPSLWLCRISLWKELSPGVDECHNIGWRITAERMGTREGQLIVQLKSKQPQTEGGG